MPCEGPHTASARLFQMVGLSGSHIGIRGPLIMHADEWYNRGLEIYASAISLPNTV
jgi:hypothetical protein